MSTTGIRQLIIKILILTVLLIILSCCTTSLKTTIRRTSDKINDSPSEPVVVFTTMKGDTSIPEPHPPYVMYIVWQDTIPEPHPPKDFPIPVNETADIIRFEASDFINLDTNTRMEYMIGTYDSENGNLMFILEDVAPGEKIMIMKIKSIE